MTFEGIHTYTYTQAHVNGMGFVWEILAVKKVSEKMGVWISGDFRWWSVQLEKLELSGNFGKKSGSFSNFINFSMTLGILNGAVVCEDMWRTCPRK